MLSLTHSFNTGGSLCIGLAGTRQATRRTAMMLHEAAINNSDTIIIFFMSESMCPLDCFTVYYNPAAMARQPARTHVPPVPDPSTRLLTSVSFATPVLYHFTRRICRGGRARTRAAPRYLAGLLLRATVALNAVVSRSTSLFKFHVLCHRFPFVSGCHVVGPRTHSDRITSTVSQGPSRLLSSATYMIHAG